MGVELRTFEKEILKKTLNHGDEATGGWKKIAD
jgi:hypothetical protein